MLKTFVKSNLLFSLFLTLAPALLFAGETVTILQTVPAQTETGKEFTIEVEISKGAIGGFAKYQIELPDGITVREGDSKGASFTFADQKVKFIWMSLPADASFKVNFKATAALAGNYSIPGTFSYVENNETQKAKANPSSLTVGAGGAVIAQTEPLKKEEPVMEEKPKETATPVSETPSAPKVEEKAPVVETPISEKAEEKKPLAEEAKAPIAEKKEEVNSAPAPENAPSKAAESVNQNTTAPVATEEPKVEPMVVSVINSRGSSKGVGATPPTTKLDVKAPVESSKPSVSGIVFRVQLGATHSESDKDSLQQKTGASQIYTEKNNDWFKFSAGNFSTYIEARDYRNEMKAKGITGAFIIANKNGTLMNLQDALKESHQKWVP